MASETIKITGMFELEITLPSGMVLGLSSSDQEQAPTAETPPAYPKTTNGRHAENVAKFIRQAGLAGRTRNGITKRFPAIKSKAQRDAVFRLIEGPLYRKSLKQTGGTRPAEVWTYWFAADENKLKEAK